MERLRLRAWSQEACTQVDFRFLLHVNPLHTHTHTPGVAGPLAFWYLQDLTEFLQLFRKEVVKAQGKRQ